jgi:hypothetical protein
LSRNISERRAARLMKAMSSSFPNLGNPFAEVERFKEERRPR